MEENNYKYANTLNLPTLNFKSQTKLNIDSNASIKQVLNIETCLLDTQIEPMSNKALVKGSIGIKVMYVDMDNMFNTLSDTITFSENIINDNITSNSQIAISNNQFISEFENDDKSIHINVDGTIDCVCNTNNSLNLFNPSSENLICKKSIMQTCYCVEKINKNTSFNFDFKLETPINKILSYDSKVVIDDANCYDGYVLINGQILNTIIYESNNNGYNSIKVFNNSTPFKSEVEASACNNDCFADMSAYINLNSTQITTDINETQTCFNMEYCIVTNGYIYKNINIDIIEDAYSLNNFVELVSNDYKLCNKMPYLKSIENVDTEITLADELNVDEILGIVNTSATITQHTIKENALTIEGVISGNLLYLDETREIKHLPTQVPYSISIKQEFENDITSLHLNIVPMGCKCKIKRGNTLMLDYELSVAGSIYTTNNVKLIDNIKLGKSVDYGNVAFQIYIAHTGETDWDLCKRLHITKEQLMNFNTELPSVFTGGEKVVVYR